MDDVVLARTGDPFAGAAFAEPCYRIPALTVTTTGRVLVAYDVRRDWRDLPGEFDIALRHSDDHGRTWSEPRTIRRHTAGHGFGDASLLTDPATGRVLCWHVGSTGRSFFDAEAGPTGEGLELWLSVSDDDAETWSHRDLTGLKPADVTGMFASSGNGTVLASGRLVQPFVLRRGEEHFAAMAVSDDSGETWSLGEWIGPDCDENKVLGLPDGSAVFHARARPRRRVARSVDGAVSFDPPIPDPALVDPACNGGLALLGDHVVCSLLDDPAERRRLTLRTSADAGETWGQPILADAGAAAYSVVAELADGSLALVWEAGDYAEIVFARISAEELGLAGAAPTLVAREGTPGAAKPPEVAG
ncbi:sialidase family protein [Ammonicoccus fulvus]|uniref:exo-alpha-sialidase n=1 Tax=Ammonicoccus fulvus TaxID=3138240 RepID=A0ABZ3FQI7_9ACTN